MSSGNQSTGLLSLIIMSSENQSTGGAITIYHICLRLDSHPQRQKTNINNGPQNGASP